MNRLAKTFLVVLIALLTGCLNKEEENLRSEIDWQQSNIHELQERIAELESTISACNDKITDAKIYEGSSYTEMADALGTLDECE